jgi:hypothetical protein
MLTLVLLALAQTPQHRLFQQPNLPNGGLAFFEAFPASGAGTFGPCSTTAPTGSKNEVLTFTRASNGTCTKTATGGLATTGIANGDLVVLSTNVARVEYDSAGTLGLLVEAASSPGNLCVRSAAICNAAWSDIGTPGCAADSLAGPWGTTTMAFLTDDTAGTHEGRAQTIATTTLSKYTWSCYLKAGTSTTAELSFTGTGNSAGDNVVTVTGLSATTSTRATITSTSAYAAGLTAITAKVLVGSNAAGTGTIYVESCDLVAGAYLTSHIPTIAVAVARAAETMQVTGTWSASLGSMAASAWTPWSVHPGSPGGGGSPVATTVGAQYVWDPVVGWGGTTTVGYLMNGVGVACTTAAAWTAGQNRVWTKASPGANAINVNGVTCTNAATGAGDGTRLWIGSDSLPRYIDGIVSRVCWDHDPTRCR